MWIFGKKGIIKSNMRTYFKARKKGLTVDQALDWVIKSRYPLSEENRKTVTEWFKDKKNLETEEDKIRLYPGFPTIK